MSTKNSMQTELLGRDVSFDYSETWVGYTLFGMRLVMGWVFLQAGLAKVLDPEGWTAAGYLANAIPAGNPFAGLFASMAGMGFVTPLVMWSQVLIGLALLFGVLVRFAAFGGAIQMLLFWASHLQGGLMAGFPIEHGWFVSSHIVYAILLFGLGAFGAGRILGLDAAIEEMEFVQNNRWLRLLLG